MKFIVRILSAVLNAFVVKTLWGWFITPFGLPSLTLAWAFGLDSLVTYLTMGISDVNVILRGEKPEYADLAPLVGVVISLIFLGMGWIAHYFLLLGY